MGTSSRDKGCTSAVGSATTKVPLVIRGWKKEGPKPHGGLTSLCGERGIVRIARGHSRTRGVFRLFAQHRLMKSLDESRLLGFAQYREYPTVALYMDQELFGQADVGFTNIVEQVRWPKPYPIRKTPWSDAEMLLRNKYVR